MSSEPAITLRDVRKSYILGKGARASTLAEQLGSKLRSLGKREQRETLHALGGVSFDVSAGSAVGIVGRNGAGKSTLLKVLTRVTPPTSGEITLRGRVGSLLEIGTGFHPELTGRENIFLNGSILGMRKDEVERNFDDIVEFAEVARFLDTPVKRYSSGMYVRLAFAVAAHLPTEIMLVDEVLAVGDAAFKSRSINKMKQITREGRTILFVSHHMPSVVELCERGIVLDNGVIAYDGPSKGAAQVYLNSLTVKSDADQAERRGGTGEFRVVRFEPSQDSFRPEEPKVFEFEIEQKADLSSDYFMGVHVIDETGDELLRLNSIVMGSAFPGDTSAVGRLVIESPWLIPGRYTIHVNLYANGLIDNVMSAATLDIVPVFPYPSLTTQWDVGGRVLPEYRYEIKPVDSLP